MAHRTPKINDTVKFTDKPQAILNDAAEQLMEAGGLTALTQAHFNEAMKIFDALRINIRKDGVIKKMAVHLALGARCDGRRDVLGMWVHENEGAAFWTSVFTELKNRGVENILIAVTEASRV